MNPKTFPIVEVCDPSGKRGLHIVWAAVDPDDRWYVVHAAKIPYGSFSEMARGVQHQRRFLPSEPAVCIMDQRGGAFVIDAETKETWFDRFRQFGLHYEQSVQAGDRLDVDIATLHDWFRPVWDPGKEQAIPKLRFCNSVWRMKEGPVWGVMQFIWDQNQTKQWHYKQKSKDWVDCLRYLTSHPGLSYRRLSQKREGSVGGHRGLATSYRRPSMYGSGYQRTETTGPPRLSGRGLNIRRRGY